MRKGGAKKAKESDFGDDWNNKKERRSARSDPTWRASELDSTDLWKRRTADSIRRDRI